MIKPQLANRWEKDKDYKVDFWYASPKLDGIRALWYNGALWTRAGKPVIGLGHIEKALSKYPYDLIDGELFSASLDFQTIQGIVMQRVNIDEEKKGLVGFHAFAVDAYSIRNTADMIKALEEMDEAAISPVSQVPIENEEVEGACSAFCYAGHEGIMLRHPEVHYFYGRSDYLLKHKLFREADFVVVGAFEGKGKYANMLGGIIVEGHGIRSECGTGFTDEQRKQYWHNDTLIGKVVEIKYQEKTADSLRFPVFLKTKEDR